MGKALEEVKSHIAANPDSKSYMMDLLKKSVEALERQEKENGLLREALGKLACLGNGDFYGNSEGNVIAQEALIDGDNV